MQVFGPMQAFVWIIGIVAASMLIIGLFSEWIFRIYFNCKKKYIADLAVSSAKALEEVTSQLKEKKFEEFDKLFNELNKKEKETKSEDDAI